MKNKFKYIYLITFCMVCSVNAYTNENYDSFQCYSTNSELSDSAYWAFSAIDSFDKKKYKEAITITDACFDIWASQAVIMQKNFNKDNIKEPLTGNRFSKSEKKAIFSNWAINDVSVAIWAKARSLEELGKLELAKKSYSNCIFLTHGRAWDNRGWFWAPSKDCAQRYLDLVK